MANEKVQITSVVSEKIKKITFKEGKFVKKNQVLIELFDDEVERIAIHDLLTGKLESREIIATVIAAPALGPSFGVAASGQ